MDTGTKKNELLSYVDGLQTAISERDTDDLEVWYRILLPAAVDAGALWVQSHGQSDIGDFYVIDLITREMIPMPTSEPGMELVFWVPEIRRQIERADRQQIDRYHAWAKVLSTR